MQTSIRYGERTLSLTLEADQRITQHRGPASLPDVPAAILTALDAPIQFPALRQALTPDDRVALVLDPNLGDPSPHVAPVVDYLCQAGISPDNLMRVTGPADESPAYIATTRAGRRIYLHPTVAHADLVVTLSRRRIGPGGYEGAEASLFPALSDEETRNTPLIRGEAQEVAFLLGLPFHVQLIDAAGEGVAQVVAGAADAAREAEKIVSQMWRIVLPRRPDTVVAGVSRPTFTALARAAACAASVIQPGGRIILLADGAAEPGPAFDVVRGAADPEASLAILRKIVDPGTSDAIGWLQSSSHARISVLSRTPRPLIEGVFASALDDDSQAQRLVSRSGDCALIEDADRTNASVA